MWLVMPPSVAVGARVSRSLRNHHLHGVLARREHITKACQVMVAVRIVIHHIDVPGNNARGTGLVIYSDLPSASLVSAIHSEVVVVRQQHSAGGGFLGELEYTASDIAAVTAILRPMTLLGVPAVSCRIHLSCLEQPRRCCSPSSVAVGA